MYFEASRIDLIAFNIKYLETINIFMIQYIFPMTYE